MKKRFLTVFVFILFSFSIFACSCYFPPRKGWYEHPDFETKYTIEEHIQRITARTEEILAEEIDNGQIKEIFVDIVYAFYDDDPEYFLVEIEFTEEKNYTVSKPYRPETQTTFCSAYVNLVGFIHYDIYEYGMVSSPYMQRWGDHFGVYMPGKSPYTICGYRNEKKYYGRGSFAVQTEEGLLRIYDSYGSPSEERFIRCIEKNFQMNPYPPELINEDEFYDLMSGNNSILNRDY